MNSNRHSSSSESAQRSPPPKHILGLSAFYHDSAACLLRDDEIIAAASEERFTRIKGDPSFPRNAVAFCLEEAGIGLHDVDYVGFYDKPLLKFERILESYLGVAPRGFTSFLRSGPTWIKEKLFTDRILHDELGYLGPILYAEHHESHAGSAFFPSPFEEAAILTADGVGEWATASIAMGQGADLEIVSELHWPDSLGLLYSAFTYYNGFRVNSGEYKLMGLAPYGEPRYVDTILSELMELKDDGCFRLDLRYFGYLTGLTMTTPAFHGLFGGPPRALEGPIEQRHKDIARSIQVVCEEVLLRMVREAHRLTGAENLCLAGGVALNCVANARLLREGPFRRIWIQPAAGDAGGSLGVAQLIAHRVAGVQRKVRPADSMKGSCLGRVFEDDEVQHRLDALGARYTRLPRSELNDQVAEAIANGKVVGWHNGRSEFGPRALGSRSILADPRDPGMQSRLNLKIKFREDFRPFAPSVLEEHAEEYFELDVPSPYMTLVAPVSPERRRSGAQEGPALEGWPAVNSTIPAVTHVDYSSRVQTVDATRNFDFHALLQSFFGKTGCPLLVNTSFNVRGEPVVDSPEDAYACFMRTGMDLLVVGSFLLEKADQPEFTGIDPEEGGGIPFSKAEGRRFATTLAGALLLLSGFAFWRGQLLPGVMLLSVGLLLGIAAIALPTRLAPFYRAWMGMATILSRLTTPILLSVIYFGVLTPTALLVRLFGRNPIVHEIAGGGFWKARAPGKSRSDLTHQF